MAYGVVSSQVSSSSSSSLRLACADVSNQYAYGSNQVANIKWTDPEDVQTDDGTILVKWAGTLLVRKTGSAPSDKDDGTIILNNTVRNAYADVGYIDRNLTNGTIYYYRFFPYTQDDIYTEGSTISVRPADEFIPIPALTSEEGTIVYDGTVKSAPITTIDDTKITVVQGSSGTNAGEYTLTLRLISPTSNWEDGSFADKSFTWHINKATATIESSTTFQANKADNTFKLKDGNSQQINLTFNTDATPICEYDNTYINCIVNSNGVLVQRIIGLEPPEDKSLCRIGIVVSCPATQNYTACSFIMTADISGYVIYTVCIDQSQSVPSLACSYEDDCAGWTKGFQSDDTCAAFDEFFDMKPCLIIPVAKSDNEIDPCPIYLNPNDFFKAQLANSKDSLGNPVEVDITTAYTSGNADDLPTSVKEDFWQTYSDRFPSTATSFPSGMVCDVMVQYPRRGLKIYTDSSDKVHISFTDEPDNADFEYMAHQRGTEQKDYFYVGTYMAYWDGSNRIRSLYNKGIQVSKTIGNFRDAAHNLNASSYGYTTSGRTANTGQDTRTSFEQHGYYQLVFQISAYCLKYAHLNSQSVIGRGYVDGNSAAKASGGTEKLGMDTRYGKVYSPEYSQTDGHHSMKLFGIEDMWGNLWSWIDGMWSNSSRHILTATTYFNDSATGYTDRGSTGLTSNISGYLTKIQGDTHKAFLAKAVGGSETTFYCDGFTINSHTTLYLPFIHGAIYVDAHKSDCDNGVFTHYLDQSINSLANTITCARLALW